MTLEEIVADIRKNDPKVREYLKELENSSDFWDRREALIEYPRAIRNYYKLWDADLGGEHPDDFSARIIEQLKLPPSA